MSQRATDDDLIRAMRSFRAQPLESIPPFVIIIGAIGAMGGLQYLVHNVAYDKPRAIGQDSFDRLVKARDERVKKGAGVQK